MNKKYRSQKGQALVFAVLMITVLIAMAGMALDIGMMVLDANRIQRACDSAALAGAAVLPDTNQAILDAKAVAALNGITLKDADFTFSGGNRRIRVDGADSRKFFLAPILGIPPVTVERHATAEQTPVTGASGMAPLAMNSGDFEMFKDGATSLIIRMSRNQDEDFSSGKVLGMSFDNNASKPVSEFEDEAREGCATTVDIGDTVLNAINADVKNQGGRLLNAMQDRMTQAAAEPYNDDGSNYTFPDYPAGDPRVFTMIVCDDKAMTTGTSYFTAEGIVAVYLEDCYEYNPPGNGASDTQTFLQLRLLPTKIYNSETDNISLGDLPSDGEEGEGSGGSEASGSGVSGVYVLRLVDDI